MFAGIIIETVIETRFRHDIEGLRDPLFFLKNDIIKEDGDESANSSSFRVCSTATGYVTVE